MPTLRWRLCQTAWVRSRLMHKASAIVVTDCGLWRKSLIWCCSSSVNSHTSWGSPIALSLMRGDGALGQHRDRLLQASAKGVPGDTGMVPRTVTPESTKEGAPWEHAGRPPSWEEGHGRREQNLPTVVQSADAHDDRAMLRKEEPRLCRCSAIDTRRSRRYAQMQSFKQ